MKKLIFIFALVPLFVKAQSPGAMDAGYTSSLSGTTQSVKKMLIRKDGNMYAAITSTTDNTIALMDRAGSVVSYYGPGPGETPEDIAIQSDDKLLLGGNIMNINTVSRNYLARLNSDGTLDNAFNPAPNSPVYALAVQPDGKILVGGNFTIIAGVVRNNIARLNPDGTIDNSFIIGNGFDNTVDEITIQNDGKILVSGSFLYYDGVFKERIVRLLPDGTLDNTFSASLDFPAKKIIHQAHNGKIFIAGNFTYVNTVSNNSMARLNNDGTLDNSFTSHTTPSDFVYDVYDMSAIDNSYLVGGQFTMYNGINSADNFIKIDGTGNLASGFLLGQPDAEVYSITGYSADKVYVGGQFLTYSSQSANNIARIYLNPYAIEIQTVANTTVCLLDTIRINYTLEGTFNSGNTLYAEISDSTGSFSTFSTNGGLTTTTSGTLSVLASGINAASGYRVRIKSTNPLTYSTDNYSDLTILQSPIPLAGPDISVCIGQAVQLMGSMYYGSIAQWSTTGTGGFSNSSALNTSYLPSAVDYSNGTVSLILSASNGICSPVYDTLVVTFYSNPSVINTDPVSAAVCEGGAFQFGVTATNAVGYEWWISSDGGTNWFNLEYWGYNDADYYGYDSPQLTIQNATYGINGYMYRCVAITGCGTASDTSAAATTTVNMVPSVAYTINSIPVCGSSTGSITATVFGTGPFGLVWNIGDTSSTINNLASGEYRLQVIDNIGCTYSGSTFLTSSDGPVIALNSITNVQCNGGNTGAISVNVSGGTSPYTYEWSSGGNTNTTTNLRAGIYELTVYDNAGCTSVASYAVTEPDPILISFTESPADCGNPTGVLNAAVTGGTPNYLYQWDSGAGSQTNALAINLNAGVYRLTVTDASSCTASARGIVTTSNPGPAVTIDSIYASTCTNPTGAIYTTIDNPTSILWNNSATTDDITGVIPGTYYLIVKGSSLCATVKEIKVTNSSDYIPEICMVTVDNSTFDNKIVWEKTPGKGVKSFNIYSENNSGNYQLIANVPYSNFSEYTHVGANPNVKAWKYRISAIDSCGNESAQSPYHKTIHLYSKMVGTDSVKVTWDNYQGFNYANFTLSKSNYPYTTWQTITTVAYCGLSICQNTYIDYPADTSTIYMAEIDHPVGCNPSKAVSKTRSNIRTGSSRIIGGVANKNEKLSLSVQLYPNPTRDAFSINWKEGDTKAHVQIMNLTGTCVYSNVVEQSGSVSVSEFAPGIYTVQIELNGTLNYKKLIIN